jgi:L-aminopeptidase/D-esterase-like protein
MTRGALTHRRALPAFVDLKFILRGENVMSRIPRICLGIALSFVLLAATAPAAQARTLSKPQSSNPVIGSLFDATLAWVSNLLTDAPHGQAAHGAKTIYTGSGSSGTGTGTAKPMTCSTIDPNGSLHCGGN